MGLVTCEVPSGGDQAASWLWQAESPSYGIGASSLTRNRTQAL